MYCKLRGKSFYALALRVAFQLIYVDDTKQRTDGPYNSFAHALHMILEPSHTIRFLMNPLFIGPQVLHSSYGPVYSGFAGSALATTSVFLSSSIGLNFFLNMPEISPVCGLSLNMCLLIAILLCIC